MKNLILLIILTFAWDANLEPNLAGYRGYANGMLVYEGADNMLTIEFSNDIAWKFVVRAYNTEGEESGDSDSFHFGIYPTGDFDCDGDVDGVNLVDFASNYGRR